MTPKHLLLVDDDVVFCETFADLIALSDDYKLDAAGSASEAELKLRSMGGAYDAILLDIGLPDADGRDFCAELRRQGFNQPIIMLTGYCSEADVVRGLESGANDYVTKPYRMPEVLARIRAQMRAAESLFFTNVSIGPFIFRHASRVLQEEDGKNWVHLTQKEADFLRFMYLSQGQPVSPRTILSEVWGYNETARSHTLSTHIYRLNRKLQTLHDTFVLLSTSEGGYQLNAAA